MHCKKEKQQKLRRKLLSPILILVAVAVVLGSSLYLKNSVEAVSGSYNATGFVGRYWENNQWVYYQTVGALRRSLEVSPSFSVNRTLLAPEGSAARSGQLLTGFSGVTIHETSNWRTGANARMHAQYLRDGGKNYEVSWHYAVDSRGAYQSVPEYEKAWHAGDKAGGKGNASTIAIEICDYNDDGNFDQAMANAEWLAADILYRHGIYDVNGHLFQHNQFSTYAKNCPITIRDSERWGEFSSKTQGYLNQMVAQKGKYMPILMTATATVDQAKNWAASKGATATFIGLADIYWSLAPRTGVDPAVAYAQAAHETGFGRFGGVINASYNNPCGLKTTAGGDNYDPAAHQRFASWEQGIQAHLDHLALYAGQLGYPRPSSPDPRHFASIFGTAQGVEQLGGKWAPSATYGTTVAGFVNQIRQASNVYYGYNAEIQNIELVSYDNKTLTAAITITNTGSSSWTREGQVNLGYWAGGAESRAFLPSNVEVASGQSYTFQLKIANIKETEKLTLKFKMLQEGVTWFGNEKSKEIVPYDAAITDVQMPKSMIPGQTIDVIVTAKNTGLKSWTKAAAFRLGADGSNTTALRSNLADGVTIAPGQIGTFKLTLKAPLSGNANLVLRMLQEQVTWFGEKKSIVLPIKNPSAAEISQIRFLTPLNPGAEYKAEIVVKNTDSVAWTKADSIRLGVNRGTSQESRLSMPDGTVIMPGQSYTFTYTGRVPASGNLDLKAQMLREGVAWFGVSKTQTVKERDAQITAVKVPGNIMPGQQVPVEVTVKNIGIKAWTQAEAFRLGANGSNTTAFRSELNSTATIKNGEGYTFTLQMKAPQTGTARLELQMLQEQVAWYGEKKIQTISLKNPSAATISEIKFVSPVVQGENYTAEITVKNTDSVVWTRADNIRIGINRATGQESRVGLPEGVSVWPGQTYTFQYQGKVPFNERLDLNAQMIKEGTCWFGEAKTQSIKEKDAQILDVQVPTQVLGNQQIPINITVKNTGTRSWTKADLYRLGADGSTTTIFRSSISDGITVKNGDIYTFTLELKAPSSGSAQLSLMMLQEGVAWFGEKKSLSIPVNRPSAAEITEIKFITPINAGKDYTAEITAKNTGSVVWTAADKISLGLNKGLVLDGQKQEGRALLASNTSVAPGQSYTFTYTGKAPQDGDLNLSAQMIQEGVTWFGDSKISTVRERDAQIVDVQVNPSVTAGVNTVTVTVKNLGTKAWTKTDSFKLGVDRGVNGKEKRAELADDQIVKNGETCEISFSYGSGSLSLQMLQESVTWFGEVVTKEISLVAPAQQSVESIPDTTLQLPSESTSKFQEETTTSADGLTDSKENSNIIESEVVK